MASTSDLYKLSPEMQKKVLSGQVPYSQALASIGIQANNPVGKSVSQGHTGYANSDEFLGANYTSGHESALVRPSAAEVAAANKRRQTQSAIDNTQKAIDSLDVERDTGYRNIDDSYSSLISKYDRETDKARGDYRENTETNTNNLSKNKQNALIAGAQGLRGLRGTLSAIGGLSGDGIKLANEAATQGVTTDVGEAADTYATNASSLDKALRNYEEEDKDRRAEAETTKVNQRTALEGSIASKRQNFFQKMAELYGDIDQGQASSFLNRAGDLNSEIASKSRVQSAAFTPKAAAFTPDAMENYLAGAGDMTVTATSGGMGGTAAPTPGVTTVLGRKRRDTEEEE